ncbi:hypothetical protein [Paenibacillus donghaensis]|uniref:exo-rhamnogalacturonan lyase family protein n=1 Tax=Paenibacillus donghaensis TaxID=414771 RepID=UPI001FE2DC40|nr:hypothetical protein [Paenibacillus donghaensis]
MSSALTVSLRWLQKPQLAAGVTWGIPWVKGELGSRELDQLELLVPGQEIPQPMQSRPAAYWPDGSIKWSTHTAVCEAAAPLNYRVARNGGRVVRSECEQQLQEQEQEKGQEQQRQGQQRQEQNEQQGQQEQRQQQLEHGQKQLEHGLQHKEQEKEQKHQQRLPDGQIAVEETADAFIVNTGVIVCTVNKQGSGLIRSIVRTSPSSTPESTEICSRGELVCIREQRVEGAEAVVVRQEPFTGHTMKAVLEQDGPLQAVVKLEGLHRLDASGREGQRRIGKREEQYRTIEQQEQHLPSEDQPQWLPYTLRLYFHAGLDSIRLVHTFHYDGDPQQDFIRGLGIVFEVPQRGPAYNRHVRFAGDSGIFSESPKTLHTRRTQGKYREWFKDQVEGRTVEFDPEEDAYFLGLLEDSATWNSFKLVQDSSEHYAIHKRTEAGCTWIKAAEGRRAGGLGYVGSAGGGLAVGMPNFWRKHPSGLEVDFMAAEAALFTAWFWSPDAAVMDLRHYDTRTHVESSYEGAEELRATPYGIANTSELMIWCTAQTPGTELLLAMQEQAEQPARLVCEPEYYHLAGAFGIWSLPDRSHPAAAALEDKLDGIITFYQQEVEQRKWYGYWDYGDFMHSYDPVRHVWNYDLGGCAWQNGELVPQMWLWLTFLRTGRSDVFAMAEAMTRHTSEVDAYHFGEYAGLGSRHNVVHWGCGCKEARIAMAGLHRYYYYLTGDERIGDIMDAAKDADYATATLDPMRAYFPPDEFPTHVRVGPDWAAFSSNWLTRWERMQDTAYRDKIITGINCIKAAKLRLLSGPTYGYDPQTGILTGMGDDNWGRHLAISMGGPQVWFELAEMLEDPEWNDMLAEFGVFYNLPQEEKDLLSGGLITGKLRFEHPVLSVGIAAYGAYYLKDQATAERCWSILLDNPFALVNLQQEASRVTYVAELDEIDWINTNEASQWSLNTIIALQLIPEALPR